MVVLLIVASEVEHFHERLVVCLRQEGHRAGHIALQLAVDRRVTEEHVQSQLIDVLDELHKFTRLTLVLEVGQEFFVWLRLKQLLARAHVLLNESLVCAFLDEYSFTLLL